MLKKIFSLGLFIFLCANIAQADVKKVAIVDIQKVVNKSAQVQALKKEQDTKKKELANFIKKAGEDIKKADPAKKKSIAENYDKQLKNKQEANAKAYKTKLEAIDKSINATIVQQAKAMGYDVVLYGGDDITEAILKVVK